MYFAFVVAIAGGTPADGLQQVFPARVYATSTLTHDGKEDHSIEAAFDDDVKTAWCEGTPGLGKGEAIEIELADSYAGATRLHIDIAPGVQASPSLLALNSAPSKVTVEARSLDDEKSVSASLDKAIGAGGVDVPLGRGGVQYVVLKIDDVAAGKVKDTCVTDIRLFVDGKVDAGAEAARHASLVARAKVYASQASGVATTPWKIARSVCLDVELRKVYRVDGGKAAAVEFDDDPGVLGSSPVLGIRGLPPSTVPNGSEVVAKGEPENGKIFIAAVDPGGREYDGSLPVKSLVYVRTEPARGCGH